VTNGTKSAEIEGGVSHIGSTPAHPLHHHRNGLPGPQKSRAHVSIHALALSRVPFLRLIFVHFFGFGCCLVSLITGVRPNGFLFDLFVFSVLGVFCLFFVHWGL
jgi:hypothetical protein